MYLNGHTLPDGEVIASRPESDNRAHIFMTRSIILVEGQPPPDTGGRPFGKDVEIGRTYRDSIYPYQDFSAYRVRDGLFDENQFIGFTKYPGAHFCRHTQIPAPGNGCAGVAHTQIDLPDYETHA
jgi:hypothetical protein